MNKSTVLVTGGGGFIMSHVVTELIASGHRVCVLDDLSGGYVENIHPSATFYQGSITDTAKVNKIFDYEQPEFVVHGAAYAAEQLSPFIRHFNYETNVLGSVNIINASVRTGVRCLVFLSSIAVYGHQTPPFLETDTPHPADPYGIAKYSIELDLKAAHDMFGLNYVVFRPHNVYGEKQNIADAYRNVVGIFMNQCLKEKPMTIFGDGKQSRAFSYIGDVAPAIASAISRDACWNQVINIGGAVPYTVDHLATEVARQMEVKYDAIHLPPRKEAVHAFCSQEKARQYFREFMRDTPLHEGVARMAIWVKKHGSRPTPPFAAIELHQNLPPSWVQLLT